MDQKSKQNCEINEIKKAEMEAKAADEALFEDTRANEAAAEMAKKKSKPRTLLRFLFVLISIGVCVIIFFSEFKDEDITGLLAVIKNSANSRYLIAAVASMLGIIIVQTLRMSAIMKSLTGKFHPIYSYKAIAYGKYYDNLTPSAIGGQPSQIYYLYKSGFGGSNSSGIIAVYFLAFQFAYLLLGILAYSCNAGVIRSGAYGALYPIGYVGLSLHAVFPAFVIFFTVNRRAASAVLRFAMKMGVKLKIVKPEKAQAQIDRAERSLNEYVEKLKYMFKHFFKLCLPQLLFTLVEVIGFGTVPYFTVKALGGTNMNYIDFLTLFMFLHCIVSIIPTPGTTGGAELIFLTVFKVYLGGSPLFWAMVIWRLLTFYLYLLQGVIITAIGDRKRVDGSLIGEKSVTISQDAD